MGDATTDQAERETDDLAPPFEKGVRLMDH